MARSSGDAVLKPIDVKRVTQTVMEQLENRIIEGGLAEGVKLPSEQQLAEQAGVGRRAIREALKGLEMKGLITIKKGSGAYVLRNDFDSYIETLVKNVRAYLKLDKAKLGHLLQFEELLYSGVIGTVVHNPDQAVIEELQVALKAQEEAFRQEDGARYTRAHLDFHLSIIDSVKNPVLTTIYTRVMKLLEPYMKKTGDVPRIMKSSIREHRQMLKAIRDGDEVKAHDAARGHFLGSVANLEEIT